MALLKAFNRLGHFPDLEKVPVMVVDHIRRDLRLPAEVQPVYSSTRTAERHRTLIRERSEAVYDPKAARKVAAEAIEEAAQRKNDPADLINIALERLVPGSFELPAFRTLNDMASEIRGTVNGGIFAMVAGRLGVTGVARIGAHVGDHRHRKQDRAQPVEAHRETAVVVELPQTVGAPGVGGLLRRRAGGAADEDRRFRR